MNEPKRLYKNAVYEQLERVGKTLASGPRIELLDLLCQCPRSVEALAEELSQSVANTSHHLQALRRARLVEVDRRGTRVFYRIADERVMTLLHALRELAEARLLEIEDVTRRFLHEPSSMSPVERDALIAKVRSGEVTVLDVRPVEEYRAGHVPGAISMPIAELERRLAELPRDREVVAYCRGPYCVFAVDAVRLLRARGFVAWRMEAGVPDFRARGLPIEITSEMAS